MKIRQVGAELFHADRSTDIWTEGQTLRNLNWIVSLMMTEQGRNMLLN